MEKLSAKEHIRVEDVIGAMEDLAPLHLAESWDNPGLMVGDKENRVSKILTALDPTEALVDEAIKEKADMIITHHPLIFKPLKSLDLQSAKGRVIKKLIHHNIALYSAHTNLDIAEHGLNDMLAIKLGLNNIRGLIETSKNQNYKLVCFVPKTHLMQVRQAIGDAGAGSIGNYSHCSFNSSGEGVFLPEKGANPFLGTEGLLETVEEARLETIVPQAHLSKVLTAMLAAHPYEEVAYDIYPLVEPVRRNYLGRVGSLPTGLSFEDFHNHLAKSLPYSNLRYAGKVPEQIKMVALCSGGGAEFIAEAKKQGADAYLTGDVKYHDAQLAQELGLLVVDGGHFGTEECVAKGLEKYLQTFFRSHKWGNIEIKAYEGQKDFFLTLT